MRVTPPVRRASNDGGDGLAFLLLLLAVRGASSRLRGDREGRLPLRARRCPTTIRERAGRGPGGGARRLAVGPAGRVVGLLRRAILESCAPALEQLGDEAGDLARDARHRHARGLE